MPKGRRPLFGPPQLGPVGRPAPPPGLQFRRMGRWAGTLIQRAALAPRPDRVSRRHELSAARAAAVGNDDAGRAAEDRQTTGRGWGYGRRPAAASARRAWKTIPSAMPKSMPLAAETWRGGRVIRDTPATAAASDSPRTTAKGTPHPQFPDMYCDYQMTAQVLSGMNIPPDFESDGDVRYVHRHELGADIYFVGNRTSAPLSATCRFRVTGLRPELWDPVTGCWHPLPEFRRAEGRTSVPLEFAPGKATSSSFATAQGDPGPTSPH